MVRGAARALALPSPRLQLHLPIHHYDHYYYYSTSSTPIKHRFLAQNSSTEQCAERVLVAVTGKLQSPRRAYPVSPDMFGDNDLTDERTPLLQFPGTFPEQPTFAGLEALILPDAYKQFCHLVGKKPIDYSGKKAWEPRKDSLYYRVLQKRKSQGRIYTFASMLTNVLLLSQIILGAALTGLGASKSSPILITLFGATNTSMHTTSIYIDSY